MTVNAKIVGDEKPTEIFEALKAEIISAGWIIYEFFLLFMEQKSDAS